MQQRRVLPARRCAISVYATAVLSVHRPLQVAVLSKRQNGSNSFWHRRFFSLIVHCVLRNSGISTDRFNHEFKSLIAGLPVRNWNSNTTDALTPVAWGTCSLNSRRSVALGSLNDMISFNWRSKVKVKLNQSNQSQISLPHGHESLKQSESDRSVPALIVLAFA